MNLKKIIDKNDIKKRIIEVSNQINQTFNNQDIVVFYIEKGGKPFFDELSKYFKFNYEYESIGVKSYEYDKSTDLKWIKKPTLDVKGKACLLIDDILDTGQTISKVKNYILSLGAKDVYICVAIDKKESRIVNIEPSFKLFDIEKGFLVGFGMDYNEQYRDLEDIYEISI
ncbi:phosphoribosyltransferase [Desulfurella sp.]|uniref:phosphoribosyltransferase n=1 Tax=Desulfurella sp. TaxID=1962857 RepID=UPI003D0A2EEB